MKLVEIYELQSDGSQKTIAICRMEHNVVVCEGDENFVQNLKQDGIKDYQSDTLLYPRDGIHFLEQLKFNFKSGYLMASDILEK